MAVVSLTFEETFYASLDTEKDFLYLNLVWCILFLRSLSLGQEDNHSSMASRNCQTHVDKSYLLYNNIPKEIYWEPNQKNSSHLAIQAMY